MKIMVPRNVAVTALLLLPAGAYGAPDPADTLGLRATVPACKYAVECIAISPDGKILATADGGEGVVRLWDTVNGKSLRTLKRDGGDPMKEGPSHFFSVAFSPDGKTLALSGSDSAIRLWDVATGESKAVLLRQGNIQKLTFSPDGSQLALGAMCLLDLKSEERRSVLDEYKRLHGSQVLTHGFDAKGQLLLACVVLADERDLGKTVMVWSAAEGSKPLTLKGHEASVQRLAISRDGALLASTDMDKVIRLWDLSTGKCVATFGDRPEASLALAFSPDGKVLAYGGRPSYGSRREPGRVFLLRVPDGKLLATLDGYKQQIGHLVFSPKGNMLATDDGTNVKLWNIPSTLPGAKDK
jgi:WD40 repeat protein